MHGRISNDSKALRSQLSCSINGAELQRNGGFHSEIGLILLKVTLLMTIWCTYAALPLVWRKFTPISMLRPYKRPSQINLHYERVLIMKDAIFTSLWRPTLLLHNRGITYEDDKLASISCTFLSKTDRLQAADERIKFRKTMLNIICICFNVLDRLWATIAYKRERDHTLILGNISLSSHLHRCIVSCYFFVKLFKLCCGVRLSLTQMVNGYSQVLTLLSGFHDI